MIVYAASANSTYSRFGISLADVFWPMKASALHAGMTHLELLTFQSISRSKLPEYQQALIKRLQQK